MLLAGIAAWNVAAAEESATAQPTIAQSHAALLEKYHAELEQLADKCDDLGLAEQAKETRSAIVPRDPGRTYLFFPPGKTSPEPADKEIGNGATGNTEPRNVQFWRRRFSKVRSEHADGLYALAKQAAEANRTAAAYRLVHETLAVFPEHAAAGRVLPQSKSRPTLVKKMRLRDPRYGWKAGEYWRIDTQHYRILTNHSPEQGRFLGQTLEELHDAWRQVFSEYWLSAAVLRRRLAGEAAAFPQRRQKLGVVLFRDKAEYVEVLRPLQPQIGVTVGIYFDEHAAPTGWGKKAYFFADASPSLATWRHEATHQLFQETGAVAGAVAERNNMWLIEAVATYMESLERRNIAAPNICFTVGGVDARRLQFARVRRLSENFYLPLEELADLGRVGLQKHEDLRRLYSQSAGLAHFFMHYQGGRYRRALVRTLRAVYSGRATPETLAEATGQSYASLDTQYRDFLNIDDAQLAAIPADSTATMLALGGTRVTAKGIARACQFQNLDWLDIAATPLNDQNAHVLEQAKNLQHLNLQGAPISDAALVSLAKLQALVWLDLSQTRITDAGLPLLAKLTNLESLWLNGGAISDAGASHLAPLRRLRVLGLEQTNVSEQGRARLRKLLPALEELY